jgi:hypothetical protein
LVGGLLAKLQPRASLRRPKAWEMCTKKGACNASALDAFNGNDCCFAIKKPWRSKHAESLARERDFYFGQEMTCSRNF